MGYLTTFTVYNDGVDLVKENAQDFARNVGNCLNVWECEVCGNKDGKPRRIFLE